MEGAADYEAIASNNYTSNVTISMAFTGSGTDPGSDSNFWIKLHTTSTFNITIFKLYDKLTVNLVNDGSSNELKLEGTYEGQTLIGSLYTSATPRWVNIDILMKQSEIVHLYGWAKDYTTLEPSVALKFTSPSTWTTMQAVFVTTTAGSAHFFWGEFKTFRYTASDSWGVYFRNYKLGSPYPANPDMIRYARVHQG